MSTSYPGHTAGQSDTLYPFNNHTIWNWREEIQLSKSVTIQPCLPGMPTTSSDNYGEEHIVDNQPWEEIRTFSSNCITRTMLNDLLTYAKKRYACFTITTALGFTFTGRLMSLSASQIGDEENMSTFYTCTVQLRSVANESSGTTQTGHTFTDT